MRAGLARLVDRGVERRRGAGRSRCARRGGSRLQSGLERLETYTIHAERLGLELDGRDLGIEAVRADAGEAALEIPEGSPLVKVSHVTEGNRPRGW